MTRLASGFRVFTEGAVDLRNLAVRCGIRCAYVTNYQIVVFIIIIILIIFFNHFVRALISVYFLLI